MDSKALISFKGEIVSGQGDHSKLGIPGKDNLTNAPDDWPKVLCPGSLNVKVAIDELPSELDKLGAGKLMQKLDNGFLKPVFVIKQKDIVNNTIGPGCCVKGRGDAQIWRAKVRIEKTAEIYDCWVLRRLDSSMSIHLELVSDKNLRETLGLSDGDRIIVSIEGDM